MSILRSSETLVSVYHTDRSTLLGKQRLPDMKPWIRGTIPQFHRNAVSSYKLQRYPWTDAASFHLYPHAEYQQLIWFYSSRKNTAEHEMRNPRVPPLSDFCLFLLRCYHFWTRSWLLPQHPLRRNESPALEGTSHRRWRFPSRRTESLQFWISSAYSRWRLDMVPEVDLTYLFHGYTAAGFELCPVERWLTRR